MSDQNTQIELQVAEKTHKRKEKIKDESGHAHNKQGTFAFGKEIPILSINVIVIFVWSLCGFLLAHEHSHITRTEDVPHEAHERKTKKDKKSKKKKQENNPIIKKENEVYVL